MSYCRWSNNDYQCDVYVYESLDGFVVHVASNQIIWKVALPPRHQDHDIQAWMARNDLIHALMENPDNYERKPINHPDAGRGGVFASPSEAADYLEGLKNDGLQVPDYVIQTLREEVR